MTETLPEGAARRVTIVAEAAQGFEGNATLAHLLVRCAAAGGADLVKFQMVYADELATPDYQHYALFRQLELPEDRWLDLARTASQQGVGLAFDVYGPRSLEIALSCGVSAVKVHATDFFNRPLVDAALQRAPRVYMSTGGIEPDELAEMIGQHPLAAERLTILYGFQAEPTATADNHLARLGALRRRFPAVGLGFMDHAEGDSDEASWLGILALPYGVSVIEKHLTLDRSLRLEDYVSALAPTPFSRYVARIRAAEAALGSPDLGLRPAERAYRQRALKVVVARTALRKGDAVQGENVVLLRAVAEAGRHPAGRLEHVVGRRLVRPVAAGTPLYEDDLS